MKVRVIENANGHKTLGSHFSVCGLNAAFLGYEHGMRRNELPEVAFLVIRQMSCLRTIFPSFTV